MARKLTATEKTQLANLRVTGFASETLVTIGSGDSQEFGSVIASNGYVTSVLTYSPQLGKVITRSWATRAVKPARFTR